MEFQKIVNFLGMTSDDEDLPRFLNKKWIEVYDQTGGSDNNDKKIKIKLELELAITEGFGEVNSVFIVITLAKILMRRLSPGKM